MILTPETLRRFDGAMGTYYRRLYPRDRQRVELASLTCPERIRSIHEAYLKAGATLLKSNTFSANPESLSLPMPEVLNLITAAWQVGSEAIGSPGRAQLAADIGPLPVQQGTGATATYLQLARHFIGLGARILLFETFAELDDLLPAVRELAEESPGTEIYVSLNVNAMGYTRKGASLADLAQLLEAEEGVSGYGLNCDIGPTHMARLYESYAHLPKFVLLQPNSGLPDREIGRYRDEADSRYYAAALEAAFGQGALLLGGCCGTGPEDIAAIRQMQEGLLAAGKQPEKPAAPHRRQPAVMRQASAQAGQADERGWLSKLERGEKIIAVEYDSPATGGSEAFARYEEGVLELDRAGMDLLTIADCPSGRSRIDSSIAASRLTRELGIEVIPHLTCRDRNLNATQALLMAMSLNDVNQVLIVTEDPLPLDERERVKTVFNTDSSRLIRHITDLNDTLFSRPFVIGAALNVNARSFVVELKRAQRKIDGGAVVFFSQPVMSERAKANLRAAAAQFRKQGVYVLAGLYPIVSQRNGLYMKHEMQGMDVPDELIARYEGLDRAEAEALAYKVTMDLARQVEDSCDGFYVMTPFTRSGLTARITRSLRTDLLR